MSPSMPTLGSTGPQWPGIDTMPVSPTPMHDSIGSGKKKRGGLGKIFNIFTGGKGKHGPKSATKRSFDDGTYGQRGPVVQSPVGATDDLNTPLAPPPPLTYLMSRKSGEGGTANGPAGSPVHGRQPSGGSTSLLNVQGAQGPSPPTAPSSTLPSPSSNRFSWRQSNASLDALPSMQTSAYPSHSASVPNSLFRDKDSGVAIEFPYNGTMHGGKHHLDALPEAMAMASLRPRHDTMGSTARPHTVFMTDKSLPPLPPEAFGSNHPNSQVPRPGTAPGFRSERSASFSGVLEQPQFLRPMQQQQTGHQPRSATEFGAIEETGKRRSKFGLSTFLGVGKRKNAAQGRGDNAHATVNGAGGYHARDMSGVVQDPQFVAYRYPSGADDAQLQQQQQYGQFGQYQSMPVQASTMPIGARR